MRKTLLILVFSFGLGAQGAELKGIQITGEKRAELLLESGEALSVPRAEIVGNTIRLSLKGTHVAPSHRGKIDLDSPHPLILRISAYPLEDSTQVNIIMRGDVSELPKRIHLLHDERGLRLNLDYPEGVMLSASENLPLSKESEAMPRAKKGRRLELAFLFSTMLLATVVAWFCFRYLRKRSGSHGQRKFLIEQLGYSSLGPKSGVALFRVGTEFILVGVTPHEVTFLSSLPKLQMRYEEESEFERGIFREAIETKLKETKAQQLSGI